MSEQYHFEFKDWEAAFEMYYRKRLGYEIKDDDGTRLGHREGDSSIVLVISTGSYVSGYWIERGPVEADSNTVVYNTPEEVRQLEQRIRNKRESTVNLSLGGVVV